MARGRKSSLVFALAAIVAGSSLLYSQDDFEKWKKAETDKYQQWKDERDKAFTEFLKTDWQKFKAFKEQSLYDSPKPKTLPIAPAKHERKPELKQKPLPEQKPEIKVEPRPENKPDAKVEKAPEPKLEPKPEVKPILTPETQPLIKPEPKKDLQPEANPEIKPETKPETKPEVKVETAPVSDSFIDPAKNPNTLSLDFYEANVPLLYANGLNPRLEGTPSGKTISAFWEAMSKSNYEDFVKQATLYKNRMNLNDWGYCEFINKTAERLYPGSRNESNMFDWFMLLKSGYQAKIGYSGENIYLLLPSSGALYGVAYYMFGTSTTKFYSVMFDRYEKPRVSTLYSYDQNYPDATKLTGYQIETAPSIRNDIRSKTLKFTHNGSEYSLTVKYDNSAVKFYEFYPQTDLEVYFDSKPSTDGRTSLLDALRPFVQDKSETEAVDLLLHFVQTAFAYKTDDEQFGREKPFFPEETLFYPGSDCEDRAVLFSFLVRNLLGLEVVGLDYPNHVATAVRFNGDVNGDQVVYQSRRFIICDPTYINADYGMCMPQFKKVKPGIIALK
ncbi:MAG TPA: hypothetical protein VI758_05520 [Bacteroidota bacterium]